MVSAKSLLGNELPGGKLQMDVKKSNFNIFESTPYIKSGSMPLILFFTYFLYTFFMPSAY